MNFTQYDSYYDYSHVLLSGGHLLNDGMNHAPDYQAALCCLSPLENVRQFAQSAYFVISA